MTAPYVLGGLLVAAGAFYVTTRILLRRRLANEAYRERTTTRIKAAGWRTHRDVVYLEPEGYVYASTKPEQPRGGGSDARQRLADEVLGVVSRGSLAGGKGVPSDLPQKPTRAGGSTA